MDTALNPKNMDSRLFARFAIREAMGIVIMGVALFRPAGEIDWWPGLQLRQTRG